MTFLRLISFGMDRYWMLQSNDITQSPPPLPTTSTGGTSTPGSGVRVASDPTNLALEAKRYGLIETMAFAFYPPLYIAGPVASFNSFVNQV
jgi:D-alanyl-lipoteichoic acid acyltransferase DltB (MBOAT superfamily)